MRDNAILSHEATLWSLQSNRWPAADSRSGAETAKADTFRRDLCADHILATPPVTVSRSAADFSLAVIN